MSLNRQSKSFRITDGLLVEEGAENSGIEMKIEWGVPPPRRSKSSSSKKISSASSTTSSSTASSEADEVYALSSAVSSREVVEEVEDRTSAVCCVDSLYGKPKKTKEVREIIDVTLERAHMKGNEYDDGHEIGVVDTSGEGGLGKSHHLHYIRCHAVVFFISSTFSFHFLIFPFFLQFGKSCSFQMTMFTNLRQKKIKRKEIK